jgi:energy-coupling factor transport system permease protein
VPLFAGCLHRADVLALAMEARGFRGSASRTQLEPLGWRRADGVVLGLGLLALAAGVAFGGG